MSQAQAEPRNLIEEFPVLETITAIMINACNSDAQVVIFRRASSCTEVWYDKQRQPDQPPNDYSLIYGHLVWHWRATHPELELLEIEPDMADRVVVFRFENTPDQCTIAVPQLSGLTPMLLIKAWTQLMHRVRRSLISAREDSPMTLESLNATH